MKKTVKKSVLNKKIYIFKTDSFHKITAENENYMPTQYTNSTEIVETFTELNPYAEPFCIANTRTQVIKIITELLRYQTKVIDDQALTIREQQLQLTIKTN